MMLSPDELFSTEEAAEYLRKSPRQVQRYLKSGTLKATNRAGARQITALSLWEFQGIDQEMTDLWLRYCQQGSQNDDDK